MANPHTWSRLAGALTILAGLGGVSAVPKSTLITPPSSFFATSLVEYSSSVNIAASDGDLWPTTWADDDYLYTANGDGRGFSTNQADFADAW